MGYRVFASLSIAIIGNGVLNDRLSMVFSEAGHCVYLAQNGREGFNGQLSDNVTVCGIEEAARASDFVIIAAPHAEIREIAYLLGDLRKKVVIDLSANLSSDVQRTFNTMAAISAITGAKHVVKALLLDGYEHLFRPLFGGTRPQFVVLGDSVKAKTIIGIVFRELGLARVYDFGKNEDCALFDHVSRSCVSIMTRSTKQ